MKNTLITGGKLALICGVAAIVLGLINAVTEPVIKANKERALKNALEKVSDGVPVGEEIVVDNNPMINSVYPLQGPEGGSILRLTGTGYGGDMEILAGYRKNGEIFSVVLMENQETPGLGKKAEDPEYMKKFIGTGGKEPVPERKNMLPQEEADAITGATITFVGIANALAAGSDYIQNRGE